MPERKDNINFTAKMKEMKPLFFFIFFAAAASIIVMNLLIIPVTVFAVKFKPLFTKTTILLCIILLIFYIIRRINILISVSKNNGIPVFSAFASSLIRRLKNTGYVFTVVIISAGLFFIIYTLLSYNNSFISQFLK